MRACIEAESERNTAHVDILEPLTRLSREVAVRAIAAPTAPTIFELLTRLAACQAESLTGSLSTYNFNFTGFLGMSDMVG